MHYQPLHNLCNEKKQTERQLKLALTVISMWGSIFKSCQLWGTDELSVSFSHVNWGSKNLLYNLSQSKDVPYNTIQKLCKRLNTGRRPVDHICMLTSCPNEHYAVYQLSTHISVSIMFPADKGTLVHKTAFFFSSCWYIYWLSSWKMNCSTSLQTVGWATSAVCNGQRTWQNSTF